MSRKLDYFTITIVALCIIAIIFLLVKMTDLISGKKDADPIKDSTEQVADDEDAGTGDETYDYDLSEDIDSTGTETPDDFADDAEIADEPLDDFEEEAIDDSIETESESAEQPAAYNTLSGDYMVIAGTFKIKENGDNLARRLQRLNYKNAQSVLFDKGTYAVVLVDRFSSMSEAKKMAAKLKADGYEAYVDKAKN